MNPNSLFSTETVQLAVEVRHVCETDGCSADLLRIAFMSVFTGWCDLTLSPHANAQQ